MYPSKFCVASSNTHGIATRRHREGIRTGSPAQTFEYDIFEALSSHLWQPLALSTSTTLAVSLDLASSLSASTSGTTAHCSKPFGVVNPINGMIAELDSKQGFFFCIILKVAQFSGLAIEPKLMGFSLFWSTFHSPFNYQNNSHL